MTIDVVVNLMRVFLFAHSKGGWRNGRNILGQTGSAISSLRNAYEQLRTAAFTEWCHPVAACLERQFKRDGGVRGTALAVGQGGPLAFVDA
ncbi:hypothetical protein [Neotabrizicola sp. sgz301269]|uniref:hypothetical protein n=1 Tax=Neotabrizicola sp. sgz301269 TaxID=3276282 RepID=UPI00377045A5